MAIGRVRMFYFLQIHFLRSILRLPHTDRIPDGLPAKVPAEQKSWYLFKTSNRNRKTGIRRIPTGLGNLAPGSIITVLIVLCYVVENGQFREARPTSTKQAEPQSEQGNVARFHLVGKNLANKWGKTLGDKQIAPT